MDDAYPGLHTVPPRPQLSYTVEQKRAIVDALVSDRENARYTGQLARYRTGLSAVPPPPRQTPASDEMPQIVGAAPAPEPAQETAALPADEAGSSSDEGYRTLDQESADSNDGSLDDFVRDLVRETEPAPAPEALAPPPGEPAATAAVDEVPERPAPAESDDGPTDDAGEQGRGPLRRILGWLGSLFGGGEHAAEEASGSVPETAGSTAAGPGSAPGTVPAGPDASAKAGLHRPALKPDEGADPPAPAPAKPLAAAARGAQALALAPRHGWKL